MRNRLSLLEPLKIITLFIASLCTMSTHAQDETYPDTEQDTFESRQTYVMNNAILEAIITQLDSNVQGNRGQWRFMLNDTEVYVITDERADRMRIMTPIAKTSDVDEVEYFRMLQANFDSVLDARYAIANNVIWSAFIHPLSTLSENDFLSAVSQTVNARLTFGESYSSGALLFGGGDAEQPQEANNNKNNIQ